VVEYDVLERKKSLKRVREVGSVEAKDIMQWNDLEGVGAYREVAALSLGSGGAASLDLVSLAAR
jgi:hypothetical protein